LQPATPAHRDPPPELCASYTMTPLCALSNLSSNWVAARCTRRDIRPLPAQCAVRKPALSQQHPIPAEEIQATTAGKGFKGEPELKSSPSLQAELAMRHLTIHQVMVVWLSCCLPWRNWNHQLPGCRVPLANGFRTCQCAQVWQKRSACHCQWGIKPATLKPKRTRKQEPFH
jgi:hypothetical protein